jgi:hypothetical protein
MQTIQPSKLLKAAFTADALACGASSVLQVIAAAAMSTALALPAQLLTGTGIFLGLYAASLLMLMKLHAIWRPLVWLIIIGNVGWAIITLDLLVTGMIAPNGFGLAYLAVQSITVVGLAAMEYAGLKTSRPIESRRSAPVHP